MPDPSQTNPFAGNAQGYWDIQNSIVGQGKPGGGQWSAADVNNMFNQMGTDFVNQFQTAVGRGPTPDEINQYFQNVIAPLGGQSGGFSAANNPGSANQLAQNYIPTAFSSQIKQNNQNQLQNSINQLPQTLAPGLQKITDYYTSGPGMDQIKQALNQTGMLDSGAFNSALAQDIAGNTSQYEAQAIGQLGAGGTAANLNPSFQNQLGQASMINEGQNQQGQGYLNFDMQQQMANELAKMMQPSFGQTYVAPAVGGFAQGAGNAVGKTFICTAMRKAGILTDEQVKKIHDLLYPMFPKYLREVVSYFIVGPLLVQKAEEKNVDWNRWKKSFYDDVVSEQPEWAFIKYHKSFFELWKEVFNA